MTGAVAVVEAEIREAWPYPAPRVKVTHPPTNWEVDVMVIVNPRDADTVRAVVVAVPSVASSAMRVVVIVPVDGLGGLIGHDFGCALQERITRSLVMQHRELELVVPCRDGRGDRHPG